MSAIIVVVANAFRHETLKMALVENDDVVEQVAAAVADETLRQAVLPRTFESCPLRLCAESLDCLDHFRAEDRVPVVDQIPGRCVVGKRLAQLLGNPGGTRIPGDIEVNHAPSIVREDEETVEHAEAESGHGKEIHRRDSFPMIAQKSRPSLGRITNPWRSPHPAQHGSLRKIEAKHFQFAVDAWCAPCGVFRDHAKDHFAQFLADTFSARPNPMSRVARPIQLESCTAPATDSLWLDEDQGVLPFRPEPPQDHPEQLVGSGELRARMPLLHDGKLLAKSQVLKQQVAARSTNADKVDN